MRSGNLFNAGWRIFFWAAGVWAVLSVAVWVLWLWAQLIGGAGSAIFAHLDGSDVAPQAWHAHELIFGYAAAALSGFFLTAVPNWTGAKAAPTRFMALVFALWMAGRIAVCLSGWLPAPLVAVVDLAFLPVLGAKLFSQLLQRPKPQNMVLLVMLSLIWIANLLVHLEWMGIAQTQWQGLRGGLLIICTMISVIGGRVVPAFTRNALLREGREDALPVSRKPLDIAAVLLPALTALAVILGLPDALAAVPALLAGPVLLLRLAGWQGNLMWHQPIVWTLHVSYAMLAAGLLLWGLAGLGIGSEIGAVHVLGIGAVGGMTLAVMSRASLGHSGRPLIAPRPVALAYALIPLAALLRLVAALWPGAYTVGVIGSGLIWILVFSLYLRAMWPVFFGPRADGRPG
ncbi:MAG: NnrS family protein [Paracoccus sp. (in: a-proteobacteria)]